MGGERAFFLSLVRPGAGRRAGDEEDGGGRERWDRFSIRDAEPDETLPTDRRVHRVVVYRGAARARPCLEAVVERASIRPAEIRDVDVGVGRDGIVGGARAVEVVDMDGDRSVPVTAEGVQLGIDGGGVCEGGREGRERIYTRRSR